MWKTQKLSSCLNLKSIPHIKSSQITQTHLEMCTYTFSTSTTRHEIFFCSFLDGPLTASINFTCVFVQDQWKRSKLHCDIQVNTPLDYSTTSHKQIRCRLSWLKAWLLTSIRVNLPVRGDLCRISNQFHWKRRRRATYTEIRTLWREEAFDILYTL